MRALGLVEPQRAGDRVEHLRRDARDGAALDPRVVLDAHAGERRHLAAAQAADLAARADGDPHLLRADPLASRDEELAHLGPGIHGTKVGLPRMVRAGVLATIPTSSFCMEC